MRFAAISAATLAFMTKALAQTADFDALTTPLKGESVPAGKTYTVKWLPGTYTTGTATLTLLGGKDDKTLQDLGAIASGVSNGAGSYDWTVDASLGDQATYGIKISLDSNPTIFQYSFPFQIAGTKNTASTSSSAGYPVSPISSSSSYAVSSSKPASSYPTTAPTKTLTTSAIPSSNATVSTHISSAPVYSTSTFATLTPSANLSTTATRAPSSVTSLVSATSSAPSSVATGAAPRVAAGSLALLGGLAAAVFAL